MDIKTVLDTYLTKSFRASEMRCKCRRPECDAVAPDMAFMTKLQKLRDIWGQPLTITSGCRCRMWNALQPNSSPHSQHVLGKAADLLVTSIDERALLVVVARRVGMYGIGLGRTFLHVDDRSGPAATWIYPK